MKETREGDQLLLRSQRYGGRNISSRREEKRGNICCFKKLRSETSAGCATRGVARCVGLGTCSSHRGLIEDGDDVVEVEQADQAVPSKISEAHTQARDADRRLMELAHVDHGNEIGEASEGLAEAKLGVVEVRDEEDRHHALGDHQAAFIHSFIHL